ncbi:MAG: hypothetical protein FGM41_11575 [Bacteroidetes bacterium]|nr:hypothetical protein [Bacteroidota bacterium]
MKKRLLFLTLLHVSLVHSQSVSDQQKLRNLHALGSLYGCVRWFNPATEAGEINLNEWSMKVARKVMDAPNDNALIDSLSRLTLPIMPGMRISNNPEAISYPKDKLQIPKGKKGVLQYWQHHGVNLGGNNQTYKSVLVNGKHSLNNRSDNTNTFVSVVRKTPSLPVSNTGYVLEVYARCSRPNQRGYIWVRADDEKSGTTVFFENMNGRPIVDTNWRKYTIEIPAQKHGVNFYTGAYTIPGSSLLVDDLVFYYKDSLQSLKPIWFYNFEQDAEGAMPYTFSTGIGKGESGKAGSVITTHSGYKSVRCARLIPKEFEVKNQLGKPLFKEKPNGIEMGKAELVQGIWLQWPMSMYSLKGNTYPSAASLGYTYIPDTFTSNLNADNLDNHLCGLFILYNVGKHFYPYPEVVKANWDSAFDQALLQTLISQEELHYYRNLQRFSAILNDGHIFVSRFGSVPVGRFYPNFFWERIEGKVIITSSLLKELKVGNEVVSINGQPANYWFDSLAVFCAAATPGFKEYRLNTATIEGKEGTEMELGLLDQSGKLQMVSVKRTTNVNSYYANFENTKTIEKLRDSIWYINLDKAEMSFIYEKLDSLAEAKAVIFDLRGYPAGNHAIIQHLLPKAEKAKWMHIPHYLYPGAKPVNYTDIGWNLKPSKPKLKTKVIFITNGTAISYAESFMGYIEGYKLASIIGEPTAGSNGNINIMQLPGAYAISFTGMKVTKIDGSTLHGVGITPTIPMKRTVSRVREGRDELLEKALEEAGK